jgi:hypothetical protein
MAVCTPSLKPRMETLTALTHRNVTGAILSFGDAGTAQSASDWPYSVTYLGIFVCGSGLDAKPGPRTRLPCLLAVSSAATEVLIWYATIGRARSLIVSDLKSPCSQPSRRLGHGT